jgi:hypothetical protein
VVDLEEAQAGQKDLGVELEISFLVVFLSQNKIDIFGHYELDQVISEVDWDLVACSFRD